MIENRFAVDLSTGTSTYNHGFSPEEVLDITSRRNEIMKRDLKTNPLSIEEQTLILKWCRINRTETFILNSKVKKEKSEKTKVEKVKKEKVKKLTKKEIKARITILIMKIAQGEQLSDEENIFYETHTGGTL